MGLSLFNPKNIGRIQQPHGCHSMAMLLEMVIMRSWGHPAPRPIWMTGGLTLHRRDTLNQYNLGQDESRCSNMIFGVILLMRFKMFHIKHRKYVTFHDFYTTFSQLDDVFWCFLHILEMGWGPGPLLWDQRRSCWAMISCRMGAANMENIWKYILIIDTQILIYWIIYIYIILVSRWILWKKNLEVFS